MRLFDIIRDVHEEDSTITICCFLIMIIFIGIVACSIIACSEEDKDNVNSVVEEKKLDFTVHMIAEYGYYQGQKDAIVGDIRIDTLHKTWISSPWDGDTKFIYDPSLNMIDNKNNMKWRQLK